MKNGYLVVAFAIGLLAGVMTGVPLADGRGSAGQSGPLAADPERSHNPWPYHGPIETGAVPDASGAGSMGRTGTAFGSAAFPVTGSGAVMYRDGLDTGP
jgi:hypothetical protein